MFDKRRDQLTDLNEAMSNRSFNEELHGTIMAINGAELSVRFNKMGGQLIKIIENKWQHATIEFKSGKHKGTEIQVSGSSAYSSGSMRNINITMERSFDTLYAGAGIRIKWVIANTPASWWQGKCFGLDISQPEPGFSDFPVSVGTTYFFDIYAGNASNVKLPAGCRLMTMKEEVLIPKHYTDIDNGYGGLEQWEVDPDTLEPIGVVIDG